eukprot:SAG22_NODE_2347_length_2683_cov_2.671053_3_plen_123_part_00
MDTLSALRQRVADAQRAIGLPDPPAPPAADEDLTMHYRTSSPSSEGSITFDARDGIIFASIPLLFLSPGLMVSPPHGRWAVLHFRGSRWAGAAVGLAGAGLLTFGAVGSRLEHPLRGPGWGA